MRSRLRQAIEQACNVVCKCLIQGQYPLLKTQLNYHDMSCVAISAQLAWAPGTSRHGGTHLQDSP